MKELIVTLILIILLTIRCRSNLDDCMFSSISRIEQYDYNDVLYRYENEVKELTQVSDIAVAYKELFSMIYEKRMSNLIVLKELNNIAYVDSPVIGLALQDCYKGNPSSDHDELNSFFASGQLSEDFLLQAKVDSSSLFSRVKFAYISSILIGEL